MSELTRAQVEKLADCISSPHDAITPHGLQQWLDTDAALRARLEAVEGVRDEYHASMLEAVESEDRLRQQLAAAEGRVQDNNDLVHILSNHCGESGVSEGAVKTLNRIITERDRLAGRIRNMESDCHEHTQDRTRTQLENNRLKARVTALEEALRRLYQVYIGQDDLTHIGAFIQQALTPAAAQEEE